MTRSLRQTGSRLRRRLASWPIVAGLGAVFVVSQVTIATILHSLGTDRVLALQTTFSAATFAAIVHDWQATGMLDVYWHHFRYDFVHPIWYGGFLAAALAKGFDLNRIDARHDGWLLVPIAAACLDLVENFFHVVFLTWPKSVITPLVALSGLATNLKWMLAGACSLAVGFLATRARFAATANS